MKQSHLRILIAAATILSAVQLQAGVKVGDKEIKEWQVAFQAANKRFILTEPGNLLDLRTGKIGSKQTFTLLDLNGEELADGDEIKIRYTPNSGGVPDPSKASFWVEVKEGVKRAKDGDVFTIRKVEGKYAFQTPSGKFVTGTVTDGILAVTDKLGGALLVEILDLSEGRKAAKQL